MRFFPSEPDIATVFNRIKDEDYDLQPDFQRGEVWPLSKQQRLIDTILRGWVVPPILLISNPDPGPQQVLDGQQRLASIRDFKENLFKIDGNIAPIDPLIQSLHGFRFRDLPPDVAKRFDKTTLRIFEITDFAPEEPAEIFFRLNQPTALTPAEKRNAFHGPIRDQIRHMVKVLEDSPIRDALGFSNSRMAYDDVLARFAYTIEQGTLRKKVTAVGVSDMYRRRTPLGRDVLSRIEHALYVFSAILEECGLTKSSDIEIRLNKATLFSWLLFFSRIDGPFHLQDFTRFFVTFETTRSRLFPLSDDDFDGAEGDEGGSKSAHPPFEFLMSIYTDRATSRVLDVSSVLLRDFITWFNWSLLMNGNSDVQCTDPAFSNLKKYRNQFAHESLHAMNEQMLLDIIEDISWGVEL
jgi:hypothetical protein